MNYIACSLHSFHITCGVLHCTMCKPTNYHNTANHSKYLQWLGLLWSCDIYALQINTYQNIAKLLTHPCINPGTLGQTHKGHSYTWLFLCWLTSKNLFTSTLCRYKMFGSPAGSNKGLERIERVKEQEKESLGNSCCQCNLWMMNL